MCRNAKIRFFGTKLNIPEKKEKKIPGKWQDIRESLERESSDQRLYDSVSELLGIQKDSLPFTFYRKNKR